MVVKQAAKALGTMASVNTGAIVPGDLSAQPAHTCLLTVKTLLDQQRDNPSSSVTEPLGYIRDRTGGITLEPEWNMLRAWIWLLQHRQTVLDQHQRGSGDYLGPLITVVNKNIQKDCEPLFRLLPDDRSDDVPGLSSKGKGRGQGKQLKGGEGPMPMKWVMLRFPWQAATPEEDTQPVSGDSVPSGVMKEWVKGMFRRAFGKDTFAKTLLQNGCSDSVLAEYKRQDNLEHATQAFIGSLGGIPSLAERLKNLKTYARQLEEQAWHGHGSRQEQNWQDLQRTHELVRELSYKSGSAHEGQPIPRGIAARVALMQLPPGQRPSWMTEQKCIACDISSTTSLPTSGAAKQQAQCHLCSALNCVDHAVLVGRSQTGEQEQRLGAGHIRCIYPESCDKRVEFLNNLLR